MRRSLSVLLAATLGLSITIRASVAEPEDPPAAPPPAPTPEPAPSPAPDAPAPAPVPAPAPAPVTEAEAAAHRRALHETAKKALPSTSASALAVLEQFDKKLIRTWATFRREVVAGGDASVPVLLWALDDLDWEIRAFAASCLAELKPPNASEALIATYEKETFLEGRRQLAVAIAAIGAPASAPVLRKIAADAQVGLRLAGVRGLGLASTEPADLRPYVDDPDLDVRYEALGSLGERSDPAILARLTAAAKVLVKDRDAARVDSDEPYDNGVRYEQYLLGLALSRATDPALERLGLEILTGEKPWERKQFLRIGVADGLGRRIARTKVAMPKRVTQGLANDDTSVRLACVRVLAASPAPERVVPLARSLSDAQIDVRHEAVVGLGRVATDEAVKVIRKAQQDRADEIRLACVRSLDGIDLLSATAGLIEGARDEKYMIRTLAVRALGRRLAQEGVEGAILKAAKDVDYGVREQAMAALSHHPLGEPAVPALTAGLGDSDLGVRANACVALSRLKGAVSPAASPTIAARIVDLHLTAKWRKLIRGTTEFLDGVRSPHAVLPLITALGADALETRRRADSMLRRITETSQGFDPKGDKPSREAAIERWKAWWMKVGQRLPERGARVLGPAVVTTGDDEASETEVAQMARNYKWRGLDIAMLLDSTGSMAGLIRESKERIDEIIAEMQTLLPSLRISIYSYRDEGSDYVYYGTPLTFDPWKLSGFLQPMIHGQGGDIPEAVADSVVNATTALSWRPEAYKVVMFAGDAPHHPEQESRFLSTIRGWFTKKNEAQLDALFTDTDRRALDVKARRDRGESKAARSPVLEKYRLVAETGRGRAIILEDESALIRELLVIAFGEKARSDIEILLDFER